MGKNKAELRADFRQFYQVSADEIGRTLSVEEAADLAAMLPPQSRCMVVLNMQNTWGTDEYLLAYIANTLAYFFWSTTEDGAHGRKKPHTIYPPGMAPKKKKIKSMTIEACDAFLKRKRVKTDG